MHCCCRPCQRHCCPPPFHPGSPPFHPNCPRPCLPCCTWHQQCQRQSCSFPDFLSLPSLVLSPCVCLLHCALLLFVVAFELAQLVRLMPLIFPLVSHYIAQQLGREHHLLLHWLVALIFSKYTMPSRTRKHHPLSRWYTGGCIVPHGASLVG